MEGGIVGWIIGIGLLSLLASMPLWLAARAISEGWHSGRLQYVLKAKKHGVNI